jgi:hypothetical protein
MTTHDNDRQNLDRTAYSDEPGADTAGTTYSDEPDADTARTAYSDEPGADADRTADFGDVDRAPADEADRAAYGNADRLEEDRATADDVSGDALDRPINGDSYERPAAEADTAPEMSADDPLVPDDLAVDFKARWDVIQQGFVDDPRTAVSEADKLVDDVLKRLSDTFERQHQSLEGQWADGEPSTEDLRGALQRYRTFFQRLVTL